MYERVLSPLDAGPVDEFFRTDYVQHSPLAGTGSQALKDFLSWAKGAAPGCTHDVKRMFADGDHVVAHTHVVIEPGTRGNAVMDIFRVQDGLIAEHWDVIQEVPAESRNSNGMF